MNILSYVESVGAIVGIVIGRLTLKSNIFKHE